MWLLALTGLTFLTNFLLWLITLLYGLIASAFGVFMQLSSAELFDNEFITSFTDRIYLILGIVALFLLSYTFLQAIINPEEGTKNGGQIVKRLVVSLVVVALVPTLFDVLYQVQNAVLTQNTIPRLFFTDDSTSTNQSITDIDNDLLLQYTDTSGEQHYLCSGCINSSGRVGGNAGDFIKNCVTATTPSACVNGVHQFGSKEQAESMQIKVAGNQLSYLLLSSFIHPYDENQESFSFDPSAGWDIFSENTTFANVENLIILTGDFSYASMFIDEIEEGNMEFNWLFALIAGGFLCYMIVSFCFDLGIRVVKLLFLQLVAPVPIFMSVYPKNADLLTNWFKMTMTTFLEVFIRVFCITFAIYLVNIVSSPVTESLGLIGNAFVIMGIIAFVKELPKLFGEITGIKGSGMSLGIKDKLKAGGALTAGLGLASAAVGTAAGFKQGLNNYNTTKGSRGKKILSALAGYGSAESRSLWNNRKANNLSDLKQGYTKGVTGATRAKKIRDMKNDRYAATYNGNAVSNTIRGRSADALHGVKKYAGLTVDLDDYDKTFKHIDEYNEKVDAIKSLGTTALSDAGVKNSIKFANAAGAKRTIGELDEAYKLINEKGLSSANSIKLEKLFDFDKEGNDLDKAGITARYKEFAASLKNEDGSDKLLTDLDLITYKSILTDAYTTVNKSTENLINPAVARKDSIEFLETAYDIQFRNAGTKAQVEGGHNYVEQAIEVLRTDKSLNDYINKQERSKGVSYDSVMAKKPEEIFDELKKGGDGYKNVKSDLVKDKQKIEKEYNAHNDGQSNK